MKISALRRTTLFTAITLSSGLSFWGLLALTEWAAGPAQFTPLHVWLIRAGVVAASLVAGFISLKVLVPRLALGRTLPLRWLLALTPFPSTAAGTLVGFVVALLIMTGKGAPAASISAVLQNMTIALSSGPIVGGAFGLVAGVANMLPVFLLSAWRTPAPQPEPAFLPESVLTSQTSS